MMRRLLLLAALLGSAWSLAAQSRTEEFTVESILLGCGKTCSVYLPDGYDTDTIRCYPVLYLLHGASDTHTAWLQKGELKQIADKVIAEGVALPMVIVMPDASGEEENHTGLHMGYFDMPGWSYEQFFFREFMPAVEQQYRIAGKKSHRAIAGLSMGGGGTMAYAQHHPELFGSACPLSAWMKIGRSQEKDEDAFDRAFAENSPLDFLRTMTAEQAEALRTVRWWVECGDDDYLWEGNVLFYSEMRKRGIPLEFRMRDGGHTWGYWRTALPNVLTFVSTGFSR